MRRLRDESGVALVMAVGILAVLMITGGSVVYYAGANASMPSARSTTREGSRWPRPG